MAAAMFDLEKSTFMLIIRNAEIDDHFSPVGFGLKFDTCNETEKRFTLNIDGTL